MQSHKPPDVNERAGRLQRSVVYIASSVVVLHLIRVSTKSASLWLELTTDQLNLLRLTSLIVILAFNGYIIFGLRDRVLRLIYTVLATLLISTHVMAVTRIGADVSQFVITVMDAAGLLLLLVLCYRISALLMSTYQQRHELLLENLAYGTSHRVGKDFLSGLVESIAETLQVQLALVSESDTESGMERIVSCAASDGGRIPDRLTPGQQFNFKQETFTAGTAGHVVLQMQLTDRNGVSIGHLVLLHEPGRISPGQRSSLQIFASRASAEVQRIKADRKSQEMETRMHQVQKLESLGVLAGGIAHDFNNLLQAIQGYTTLAADSQPHGSTSREAIGRIDDVISKGSAMCDRLLAYAGRSVRSDAVCDLNQLVTEAVDIVRSARPECTVILDQTNQPLNVWGDLAQLSQVLINLLTNAADAIDAGRGEIRASTHVCHAGSDVGTGLELNPGDEYAVIKIRDNGCGIPDDAKPKLFDPFFTSKGDGRGIGLAAVSGIVKTHQGDITFSSEEGAGTTFVVAFPLTSDTQEHPASSEQRTELPSNLRILAVDDDELVLATTRLLLESAALNVTTANSGQQAVSLIEENGKPFDVVLLDQTMPGMSGLETCEVLRSRGVQAPFILMSGYCKIEDVAKLEQVTCLCKPYSRQELLDAISEASGHSMALHSDAPRRLMHR